MKLRGEALEAIECNGDVPTVTYPGCWNRATLITNAAYRDQLLGH